MIKHPYSKAAGISLAIHTVLIGILTIGYSGMFTPPAVISPIEVEFALVNVVDQGDSLNKVNSSPAPAALQLERQAESSEQQTKLEGRIVNQKTAPAKSSQQSGANETSAVSATANEITTEGVTAASGGDVNEPSVNGPVNRSIIRSQPGYISGPRPVYPLDARRAGQEGTVVLRTLVSTDGSAVDVVVLTSSGCASLDEAAMRAVKKWRFAPARYGSTAVESYYDVRVKFRLDDWQ
ncbi:energy transducer TonB [Propionispora vibrioides]|uniref:Protein TonB n=1 Tax=Propionispora vibrioides TaxID=112903 RepID=A0A1H8T3L2_9FIRM|nr:energy transducer TonB [Propionispora vibrioides]SEO85531.1 protein TonB [Propionispora vibrioides]